MYNEGMNGESSQEERKKERKKEGEKEERESEREGNWILLGSFLHEKKY